MAGRTWAGGFPGEPSWSVWLARGAALAPAVLAWGPVGVRVAWPLVAALAMLWGGTVAGGEGSRPCAVVPVPVAPAIAATWQGEALIRTTGLPSPTSRGDWQAPGVILAVSNTPMAYDPGPRRGDGVLVRARSPAPAPLTIIAGRFELRPPAPASLAGGFDDRRYLGGRGLLWRGRLADKKGSHITVRRSASGSWFAGVRAGLIRRLDHLLPPREARLAGAVLLGARTADTRREAANFTQLGLAHLFAVSGLHVGILVGFVAVIARGLGCGGPGLLLVMLPLVPSYMLLTGLPGSVVRAGGMVLLVLIVATAGRRSDPLRLLGLLFWAMVVWDPPRILDIGSLLSYSAAAGILAVGRLTDGFAWTGHRRRDLLLAGLGVSIAAQWATLPLVADAFGRINLWSPLANLVAVPVFGVLVGFLAAALALADLLPWVAEGLAAAGWVLARSLAGLAAWAGRGAGGAVGMPAVTGFSVAAWLVLGFLLAWCAHRRFLVILPFLLAAGIMVFGPASRRLPGGDGPVVHVFDVGQGDCSLVVFPDGWSALIDVGDAPRRGPRAGPFARNVAPWLARQGLRRFDAVILTHGHRDHTGGAPEADRLFATGDWWSGGRAGVHLHGVGERWRSGMAGSDTLHVWGDWCLRLVDPADRTPVALGENDRSLVTILERGDATAMVWTGDLEEAGEAVLLEAGLVPASAEVWKAGHHGSRTSGSRRFLSHLAPLHVLISCGLGNRHDHPSHGPYVVAGDTLTVWRTDAHGSLRVAWEGTGPARITPRRRVFRPRLDTAPVGF